MPSFEKAFLLYQLPARVLWAVQYIFSLMSSALSLVPFGIMVHIAIRSKSRTIRHFPEVTEFKSIERLVAEIAIENWILPKNLSLTYYDPTTDEFKLLEPTGFFALLPDEHPIEVFAEDKRAPVEVRFGHMLGNAGALVVQCCFYIMFLTLGSKPNMTSSIAFGLLLLRFARRILETFAVHKFSSHWMSHDRLWWHIYLNVVIMTLLCGFVFLGLESSTESIFILGLLFHVNNFSKTTNRILIGGWAFAELSTIKTHWTLASLRLDEDDAYYIPQGYGFDWVSCPHYFFELLSWTFFAILVGNWMVWIYLSLVSFTLFVGAHQTA